METGGVGDGAWVFSWRGCAGRQAGTGLWPSVQGGQCGCLFLHPYPLCSLCPNCSLQFFQDFASAFSKLLELGVPFPEGSVAATPTPQK